MTENTNYLPLVRNEGPYYAGSVVLQPVSNLIGLPIDQINFLACHILSLLLAFPFRLLLHPSHTPPATRHRLQFVVGFSMACFCFGNTVLHLLLLSSLSYVVIAKDFSPFIPHKSHVIVFFFAMLYLCCNHIYRQVYDYGSYTLDVTGPMMLMVLKISGLAFSYNDRKRPREELSSDQLDQICDEKPTALEFFSYMFYFHGMMCGPPCTYADYKRFIEGTNTKKNADGTWSTTVTSYSNCPSPWQPFLHKFCYSLSFGIIMLTVAPFCDPAILVNPTWISSSSVPQRLYTAIINLGLVRSKYYFAYYLSDCINNVAGLGYNGDDQKSGAAKWDLIKNVDVRKVELSLSLKETVEAWNKTSTIWLRRVVYDRLPPTYNLAATYAVSAVWHGFYPGYYFTFGSAALFTAASRKVRRNIRPYFQTSPRRAYLYDCLTFVTTRLVKPYCFGPFIFLNINDTLRFYESMYYSFHVGAIFLILVLPKGRPATTPTNQNGFQEATFTDKKTQ